MKKVLAKMTIGLVLLVVVLAGFSDLYNYESLLKGATLKSFIIVSLWLALFLPQISKLRKGNIPGFEKGYEQSYVAAYLFLSVMFLAIFFY